MSDTSHRLLLVHAHPDDESIGTGASMAKYAAEGAHVTLVTCTRGEHGEVLVPELEHLRADREDRLGEHRVTELAAAMKVLGVTDYRFLGGEGRYRDTGMDDADDGSATVPADVSDDSFWRADLTEAADHLAQVIREVRPQVLVTYDEFGGYGHPDHIQAHRVAMYAAQLAAAPSYRRDLGESWEISKIYWNAVAESRLRGHLRALRDSGDTTTFEGMDPDGPLPHFVVPDSDITSEIDGSEHVEQKLAAMRAHATQIAVEGGFFALADNVGHRIWGTESYRLVKGALGPVNGRGVETDLFAGIG